MPDNTPVTASEADVTDELEKGGPVLGAFLKATVSPSRSHRSSSMLSTNLLTRVSDCGKVTLMSRVRVGPKKLRKRAGKPAPGHAKLELKKPQSCKTLVDMCLEHFKLDNADREIRSAISSLRSIANPPNKWPPRQPLPLPDKVLAGVSLLWKDWDPAVEWYARQVAKLYEIEITIDAGDNNPNDRFNILIAYNTPDGDIEILDVIQESNTNWVYTLNIRCVDVTYYAIRFIPLYQEDDGEWWSYSDPETGEEFWFGTGDVEKDLEDGYGCRDDYVVTVWAPYP